MTDPAAFLGRRLGDFVLGAPLGAGGAGMVFEARQQLLDRDAVVKVARVSGESAAARFLVEARLASRLEHAFAAHIYAFGAEPDGLTWIAMERVRGTPLDVLLAEVGHLPLVQAVPFVERLAEVVGALHELGVVHRDLKPSNVMVVARGGQLYPRLLDLGIARDLRAVEGAPGAGAVPARPGRAGRLGTPQYMAPEQWVDAGQVGPAADQYALAALTYELLVGAAPFQATTWTEMARHHAQTAVPALPPPLPPPLSTVLAQGMAKQASARFSSVQAFAAAARAACGVVLDAIDLPRVDALTRDEVIARAPQPVAESMLALDGAATVGEAWAAATAVRHVVCQYVGLVALACRHQVGRGRGDAPPVVDQLIERLRADGLAPAEWWTLARELTRPFALIADAYPVPELVRIFFDGPVELRTALDAVLAVGEPAAGGPAGEAPTSEPVRAALLAIIPALSRAVRALRPVLDYRLVERQGDRIELWVGVGTRAAGRPRLPARPWPGPVEGAALLGADDRPVVHLHPLVEMAPPAPGAPAEVFLLDGPGRRGAQLVARPRTLTRASDQAWAALGVGPDAAATAERADDDGPYRGLATFTEADAELFFGREREVEALVNRLADSPLLVVVGPSGAGKSSFVQAGVVPALRGTWQALVVRPGATPLATLAARVGAPAAPGLDQAALRAALAARAAASGRGQVLVVDQFEELFTLGADAAEQARYAELLVAASAEAADRDGAQPIRIIVTLRDDFLVRAAQLPALRDQLAARLHLLTTPQRDELLRILLEPARRAGYAFEDDALPGQVVDEVATLPAALALMSFTAAQLWSLRDRQFRQLTRRAYGALGGVGGALAQHAEAVLADLAPGSAAVVRAFFGRLVTAAGTRAVMTRAELLQIADRPEAEAARVLERLIVARLVTARDDDHGGEQVEVVHEALISAWPRLVGWRQDDVETARLRDQLRAAARQWQERGRPSGQLWRGDALLELQLWRARYRGGLTDDERRFVAASEAEARRARRLRRGMLTAVVLGLTVAVVVFARLRTRADHAAASATRSATVATEARSRADQLLTTSYRDQGRRALLADDLSDAIRLLDLAHAGGGDDWALGFMRAAAARPSRARLGELIAADGERAAWEVAASDDGRWLAAGYASGQAVVFAAATGAPVASVRADERAGRVLVRFDADGRLITAGASGALRAFDPATGAQVWAVAAHTRPIFSLERDDDGVFWTGSQAEVRRWRARDGAALGEDAGVLAARRIVVLAPRGRRVASYLVGWDDGPLVRATVHDRDGARPAALGGHEDWINAAAFDPSGARLATGAVDATARVFDATSGARVHALRHDAGVTAVAWMSPTVLVTGSEDSMVRLWDATSGRQLFTLRGHRAGITQLVVIDETTLVSLATDGTARVWNTRHGELVQTFHAGGQLTSARVVPGARAGQRDLLVTSLATGVSRWSLDRGSTTLVDGSQDWQAEGPPLLVGAQLARLATHQVELFDPASGRRRVVPVPAYLNYDVVHTAAGVRLVLLTADGGLLWIDPDRGETTASTIDAGDPAVALANLGDDVVVATRTGRIGVVAGPTQAVRWGPRLEGDVGNILTSPARNYVLVVFNDRRPGRVIDRDLKAVEVVAPGGHAFSPDGQWLALSLSRTTTVAMVHLGDWVRHDLDTGSAAIALAWSADSADFFVGTSTGELVRWSTSRWTAPSGRVTGHSVAVAGLATAPNSPLLVSQGRDGLRMWDARSFEPLGASALSPAALGPVFTADGTAVSWVTRFGLGLLDVAD